MLKLRSLTFTPDLLILAVIATIGSVLRFIAPGLYVVTIDEITLLYASMRLARYGDWIWLSQNKIGWGVSWNPIQYHSPLSNYLLAIPYLLTTNPELIRVFVGLLGLLAVIISFYCTRRYFGLLAAAVAGLLLAVCVTEVDASRYISNLYLPPAFVAGWLLTCLLGYYDQKRWARIVSWVLLGCAIQFHPFNGVLIVPALFMIVTAWYAPGIPRKALVRDTLLGGLVALITFIPWIIGILFFDGLTTPTANGSLSAGYSGFSQVLASMEFLFERVLAGSGRPFFPLPGPAGDWTPTAWIAFDADLLALLIFIAIVFALAIGLIQRRRSAIPAVFLGIAVIFPLSLRLILPNNTQDFYYLMLPFAAYPLLGWLIRISTDRLRIAPGIKMGIALTLTIGLASAQIGYQVLDWQRMAVMGWQVPEQAPLSVYRTLADQWLSQSPTVSIVADTPLGKYPKGGQVSFWSVVLGDKPIRIVDRTYGQGVPLSQGTNLLVSWDQGQTLTSLFGTTTASGRLSSSEPAFKFIRIAPNFVPELQFIAAPRACFANGACLIGLHSDQPAEPGQLWPVTLVWQITAALPDVDYHFSLRAQDAFGKPIASTDFAGLDRTLWQAGDLILNPVVIQLPAGGAPFDPVQFKVVMYSYPQIHNALTISGSGQPSDQVTLVPSF